MPNFQRKIRRERFIRAGTQTGRAGLFADGSAAIRRFIGRLSPLRDSIKAEKKRPAPVFVPLGEEQKQLIMAVLRKSGRFGGTELSEFMRMHAGVRELRMRNHISSIWRAGSWKKVLGTLIQRGERLESGFERADLIADEISSIKAIYAQLCEKLGLPEPSAEQRLEALGRPGELSESQAAFFPESALKRGVGKEDIEALAESLRSMSSEDLRHHWRWAVPNIASAASIAHKLRFTHAPFSGDEDTLLHWMFQKPHIEKDDLAMLAFAFSNDLSLCGDILPNIIVQTRKSSEPLLDAARASGEFDTLLDFLGIPREQAVASIAKDAGFTHAHWDITPEHPDNDDAITAMDIRVFGQSPLNRFFSLDIVFDGVSGQGGASVASRMAKDAFEIAALAGWIRGPEDVRFAAILADLAINMDKDLMDLPEMGTTFAASYTEGNRFFGIHCGDSDWIVLRNGARLARSYPHGQGNRIWSGLGIGPKAININNGEREYEPIFLEKGDAVLTLTDGIGDVMCDHEYGLIAQRNKGDAIKTRTEIVGRANSRKDATAPDKGECGCPIFFKDDDMAIHVRFV